MTDEDRHITDHGLDPALDRARAVNELLTELEKLRALNAALSDYAAKLSDHLRTCGGSPERTQRNGCD